MLTSHPCRGAAAILAVGLSLCVLTAGLATATGVLLAVSAERAGAAADAVAHGAEVVLQEGPDRDDLSVALQGGRECGLPGGPGGGGGLGLGGARLCAQTLVAAAAVAAENGASLLELHVGPDLRDRAPGAGAGGLIVLVHVTVPRHLPGLERLCPGTGPPAPGLCSADAWSAAQAR